MLVSAGSLSHFFLDHLFEVTSSGLYYDSLLSILVSFLLFLCFMCDGVVMLEILINGFEYV